MTQSNPSDDLRAIVDDVMRRSRRRIRTLAFLAVALWVLGSLMILMVFLPLAGRIVRQVDVVRQASATQPTTALNGLPKLVKEGLVITMMIGGIALATSLLASICTVALALTIRRVTLQQLTVGLAAISEQLRELRRQS